MFTTKMFSLSNFVQLHVRYSLVEERETVVLLHFSGGTSCMWEGVLPFFEKKYSIIAPDMRGQGKSSRPETGYHIEDMANDLYLLLKEMKISTCHIVGSSMGAEIGVCFAAHYPDMVSSLVCEGAIYNEFGEYGLFNGSLEEITAEKQRLKVHLSSRELPVYSTREEYWEGMKAPFVNAGIWNELTQSYLDSTIVETQEGHFASHYQNHVRNEYIESYWDLCFEEYYKRVQCPVLFLPSEEELKNDRIVYSLTEFSKLVEMVEIQLVPNSIHAFVWMQFPELASKKVVAFLEKVNRTVGLVR
jgi:pimeloyl-ACP methyl ester carboxylesterase